MGVRCHRGVSEFGTEMNKMGESRTHARERTGRVAQAKLPPPVSARHRDSNAVVGGWVTSLGWDWKLPGATVAVDSGSSFLPLDLRDSDEP